MKIARQIFSPNLVEKSLKFNKYSFGFKYLSEKINKNDNIEYVKVTDDVKNFGKKFSKEEVEKFLDPYGFLEGEGSILKLFIFN
jgi:hypothetical protein